MSSYPPPPDPQQFPTLYPPAPSSQLPPNEQEEQIHYTPAVPSSDFSKLEAGASEHNVFASSTHSLDSTQAEGHTKANRLRKACDSCSVRKVKCDESGPPCRACTALDIPCTFERPSRRRGPPNKHAEALKKRRVGSPGLSGPPTPASPTHAAQALAALSTQPTVSAESICPLDLLELLVNDYFTYIHPLCPFPHEPTFRDAFRRREDCNSGSYLALLAAMIGVLVASFPRKPRLHLKMLGREHLFPTHMSLVAKCQQVCSFARGPGYLERDDLNVYDAATSYLLGLVSGYTYKWRQLRLYFGECLTIIKSLGLHRSKESMAQNHTELSSDMAKMVAQISESMNVTQTDNITREMGRRIFWTAFVSVRSMKQLAAATNEIFILPPTPHDPYPPLPLELDDEYVFPTHLEPQPSGVTPVITGFNVNVKIFLSYDSLEAVDLATGFGALSDTGHQKKTLHQCLHQCKSILDILPSELVVIPGGQQSSSVDKPTQQSSVSSIFMQDPALLNSSEQESHTEDRRKVQYEIQKANIYASHLGTRSYLVEKYWNMYAAQNKKPQETYPNSEGPSGNAEANLKQMLASSHDLTEEEICAERDSIVKDLLLVLSSISQVSMEPNADSLTMKIRSIASTLLDVPKSEKSSIASQAEQYLAVFLDILLKLERSSAGATESGQQLHDDEEAGLKHWADLREYQVKFAQSGGFMTMT